MQAFEITLPSVANRRAVTFTVNGPGSFVCIPCGRSNVTTLIPQDANGDDAGADLCQACSLSLFALAPVFRGSWPSPMLTRLEVEDLWRAVRAEQAAQALAVSGRPAVRTSVDDVSDRLKSLTSEVDHAA